MHRLERDSQHFEGRSNRNESPGKMTDEDCS